MNQTTIALGRPMLRVATRGQLDKCMAYLQRRRLQRWK